MRLPIEIHRQRTAEKLVAAMCRLANGSLVEGAQRVDVKPSKGLQIPLEIWRGAKLGKIVNKDAKYVVVGGY